MWKQMCLALFLAYATVYAQDNLHVFKGKPHPIKVVVHDASAVKMKEQQMPLTYDRMLIAAGMGTANASLQLNVYDGTLYLPDAPQEPVTLACQCKLIPGLDYWARFSKVDKSGKMKRPGKLELIYGNSKRQWEETVEYR